MTDCPALVPGEVPYTVLLLLPDDMRGDEPSEADWIRRVWVEVPRGDNPIPAAIQQLMDLMEWNPDEGRDGSMLAPIAVYSGHIYDVLHDWS